jgi:hypothetical protein
MPTIHEYKYLERDVQKNNFSQRKANQKWENFFTKEAQ